MQTGERGEAYIAPPRKRSIHAISASVGNCTPVLLAGITKDRTKAQAEVRFAGSQRMGTVRFALYVVSFDRST